MPFLLDGISQLRYKENRYGIFPAISDACLARRFLPKLGPHSCGPFFLLITQTAWLRKDNLAQVELYIIPRESVRQVLRQGFAYCSGQRSEMPIARMVETEHHRRRGRPESRFLLGRQG